MAQLALNYEIEKIYENNYIILSLKIILFSYFFAMWTGRQISMLEYEAVNINLKTHYHYKK